MPTVTVSIIKFVAVSITDTVSEPLSATLASVEVLAAAAARTLLLPSIPTIRFLEQPRGHDLDRALKGDVIRAVYNGGPRVGFIGRSLALSIS